VQKQTEVPHRKNATEKKETFIVNLYCVFEGTGNFRLTKSACTCSHNTIINSNSNEITPQLKTGSNCMCVSLFFSSWLAMCRKQWVLNACTMSQSEACTQKVGRTPLLLQRFRGKHFAHRVIHWFGQRQRVPFLFAFFAPPFCGHLESKWHQYRVQAFDHR
jgi:hypothetical protein